MRVRVCALGGLGVLTLCVAVCVRVYLVLGAPVSYRRSDVLVYLRLSPPTHLSLCKHPPSWSRQAQDCSWGQWPWDPSEKSSQA